MPHRNDRQHGERPARSLLDELAALRNLDRRRHALAPGSEAHEMASEQVARRSRALMDRFRDLTDESGERGG